MKWIEQTRTLELTARNVTALVDKLDDPHSSRSLVSGDGTTMVQASEEAAPAVTTTEGLIVLTRAQLFELTETGATVEVPGGITVVSVDDAAHYSTRPSGTVYMPSSGETREPVTNLLVLRHICEACGRDETISAQEAYDAGWDYPPKMGMFGVLSPRTCPKCSIQKTLWWRIIVHGETEADLSEADHTLLKRIHAEPGSILPTND